VEVKTFMHRTYCFFVICLLTGLAWSCSSRRADSPQIRRTQAEHQVKPNVELAVSLRPKANEAGLEIELSYGARSEHLPRIRKLAVSKFEEGKPVETCSIVSNEEHGQALSSWQVGSPREGFTVVGNCPSTLTGEFEVTGFDFVKTSFIRFSVDTNKVIRLLEPEDIFEGQVKTRERQ
jgi:hypothetical protein